MSLFNFNELEIMTFFAVLVRYSVLVAVLPFVGDKTVPMPAKILFSLAASVVAFPALVAGRHINPGEAAVWGATAGGIIGTIALEVMVALVLGFTARMAFDAISFGGNLAGNFMGFGSASTFDPHQETQTQVMAQIQVTIAMLVFLAIDGHHLMMRAALDSYKFCGIGMAGITALASERLIEISGHVVRFGVQLTAPIALSLFAVNIVFGIMAKAMPQLNVLVLSFAITGFVGIVVMFLSLPEFQGAAGNILGRTGEWMQAMAVAMGTR